MNQQVTLIPVVWKNVLVRKQVEDSVRSKGGDVTHITVPTEQELMIM